MLSLECWADIAASLLGFIMFYTKQGPRHGGRVRGASSQVTGVEIGKRTLALWAASKLSVNSQPPRGAPRWAPTATVCPPGGCRSRGRARLPRARKVSPLNVLKKIQPRHCSGALAEDPIYIRLT